MGPYIGLGVKVLTISNRHHVYTVCTYVTNVCVSFGK